MGEWRGQAVLGVCLLLLAQGSCLRPGQERAELDLLVGRASVEGATFVVEDGLAVVREASLGRLRLWASAPTLEIAAVGAPDAAREWEIDIRNLMPGAELTAINGAGEAVPVAVVERPLATRARWRVAVGPGEALRLRVAPLDAEEAAPYRFAILSDVQEAIPDVQDIFSRINEDPEIRFVLSTGDLTRQGEAAELTRFQEEMERLGVPLYSTTGNHEHGVEPEVWHRLWGRFNSHFSFKGVSFTLVDSGNATLDPIVYEWLEGWLSQERGAVHVVGTHITPLDPAGTRNGAFRSRKEAGKLITMLGRYGVDMTFYGHVHSYYAFSLAGIPSYISGGGGAIPERLDGVGRHFLTVDVTPGARVEQVGLVRVD
jgi:predicted phosphodiesterase